MIAAEAAERSPGYHFRGGRIAAEVYRRHCATLNGERLKLLADARRAGLQLESVIEAFVRPAPPRFRPENQNQFSRLRVCWLRKTPRCSRSSSPTTSIVQPARSSPRCASASWTHGRRTVASISC
jgi:hypothetical protein